MNVMEVLEIFVIFITVMYVFMSDIIVNVFSELSNDLFAWLLVILYLCNLNLLFIIHYANNIHTRK